ncbi:MAG: endo-1,4-beta-xylanase, partial [Prevotella sp.]
MKKTIFTLALLAISSTCMWAQWGQPADPNAALGMKDTYKDYFTIGVAVNKYNIQIPEQVALIKKEFNSITAENDMKVGEMHPAEGVWNFGAADSIADFCRQNGIKLRGHNLCWHAQFADWMFKDKKGKPVKKEVFYKR